MNKVTDIVINEIFVADLTVRKRPETSFRIEIHFTVFDRFYLLFSFMKLVEIKQLCLLKKNKSLPEIWKQSKLHLMRNLVV